MDIKIIICFMIICFLPFASSGQSDTVWTARSSGIIKSNEFLAYDNYLIKVVILDSETASITVYKDNDLVEKKDFKVFEFNKYGDIGITLLGIKDNRSWVSISKPENKNIWIFSEKALLKWGESYTIENHTFSIDTLSSDSASLTITNTSITRTVVFKKGIPIDLDNLRTIITDINRTGFVELEFYKYNIPTLDADITTDREEYFPDENVPVAINITVDGVLDIVGISIKSDPPSEIKPDMFAATNVSGARILLSNISKMLENSSITINANIEGVDYLNQRYSINVSKIIRTKPIISIVKTVPLDTDEENVSVILNIHNAGKDMEYVSVYDSIPQELTAGQLDWRIEIQPRNSTNIYYKISPDKPGGYIFPPAIAKWKIYSTSSNNAIMTAHRPYIIITKSAARNMNFTEVELKIDNTGDRPAQVNITDEIPDGYFIESGSPEWSGYIDGNKSTSIRYSLKGDIVSLPSSTATYRDLRGVIRQARSNAVTEISVPVTNKSEVVKEGVEITPVNAGRNEIISFMILSFIVISIIIASAALGAYLITSMKLR